MQPCPPWPRHRPRLAAFAKIPHRDPWLLAPPPFFKLLVIIDRRFPVIEIVSRRTSDLGVFRPRAGAGARVGVFGAEFGE